MVDTVNRPISRKRAPPSVTHSRLATLARSAALTACFWSADGMAEQLRDPMRPPSAGSLTPWGSATPVSSGPRLQTIRFSARERSATIDGRRVRVGDKIGSARVVLITRNAVVLDDGGVSQTLKLFPDFGKRVITPNQHPKY